MNDKVSATGAEETEQDMSVQTPVLQAQPKTAGEALRQLRESRGADLGQLAAVLKVRPEKLAALEADQYEQLPDMVFVRALTLSICRLFEVDAAPILALLPEVTDPQLGKGSEGLNQTFKTSSVNHSASPGLGGSPGMGYAALLVVFLLVGAGVIYFWPHILHLLDKSPPASEQPALVQNMDALAPLNTAAGTLVFPVTPTEGQAPAATADAAGTTTTLVPLPVSTPPAAVAGMPEAAPAAQTAAPQVAPQDEAQVQPDTLRIVAKEAVWIQVRDGANALLRQATLPKGQEMVLTQTPPLRVEIGRVDGVDVFVNGEPFDLAPYARSNVARFTIQP